MIDSLECLRLLKTSLEAQRAWPQRDHLTAFLHGSGSRNPLPTIDHMLQRWQERGLSLLSTDEECPPAVTPWLALAHRLSPELEQRFDSLTGPALIKGSAHVDGDVHIDDTTTVVIGGHLTVTGDLNIASNGMLVVAGTVTCRRLEMGLHLTALETVRARYVRLNGNDGCLMAPVLECEVLHRDDFDLCARREARCEVGGEEYPTATRALDVTHALDASLLLSDGTLNEAALLSTLAQGGRLLR